MLEALPPTVELAKAYVRLSEATFESGRLTEALGWARRALALAEELGDQSTVVQARLMLSLTGPDGGVDEMNRGLEEAQMGGPRREAGAAYVWVMDPPCRPAVTTSPPTPSKAAWSTAATMGSSCSASTCSPTRPGGPSAGGSWAQAATMADSVLRIPRTSISPRIIALVVLALVRARRGDPAPPEPARRGPGPGRTYSGAGAGGPRGGGPSRGGVAGR